MIKILITDEKTNEINEVGIIRIFPKTPMVDENQVCHYDFGIIEDDNLKVEGRIKHTPKDGVFVLVSKALENLKPKKNVNALTNVFN